MTVAEACAAGNLLSCAVGWGFGLLSLGFFALAGWLLGPLLRDWWRGRA